MTAYQDELEEMLRDAEACLQFLVDWCDQKGMLPEHYFSFPNGDCSWATGHMPMAPS